MARFIVEGGTPLRGEITAKGNKNSALPLIAASLLTSEPVTLRNLPRIRDVNGMLEIVNGLGATAYLDQYILYRGARRALEASGLNATRPRS